MVIFGELEMMIELMDSVKAQINEDGRSLEYYNSFQNAQDVGVLMKTLGYEKYNLYGGSYGTRLARIVQDFFPQMVNASVLNSPAPLGGDFLADRLLAYSQALGLVMKYCRENEGCNQSYPNLGETYFSMLSSLLKEPYVLDFEGQEFVINAQDAVYLIRRRLYSSQSREIIPALIYELSERKPDLVSAVIRNETIFSTRYNSSMWIAVERYEMYDPRYTEEEMDKLYNSLELFPVKLGIFNSFYIAGKHWHDAEIPYEERQFEWSDVPTLITVNQYDPVTPPEYGHIMMERLNNGQLYIMDEGGHGGGNADCRNKVMMAFMADPAAELDVSCYNLYEN